MNGITKEELCFLFSAATTCFSLAKVSIPTGREEVSLLRRILLWFHEKEAEFLLRYSIHLSGPRHSAAYYSRLSGNCSPQWRQRSMRDKQRNTVVGVA